MKTYVSFEGNRNVTSINHSQCRCICAYIFTLPISRICIRYCRRTKIRKNRISRRFDQRHTFYVVFLLYRLVCKSRLDASALFFNSPPYILDVTTCVFHANRRKLNNFLVIPYLCLNLLAVRTVFLHPPLPPSLPLSISIYPSIYCSLSLFHALSMFPRSLTASAGNCSNMRALQRGRHF